MYFSYRQTDPKPRTSEFYELSLETEIQNGKEIFLLRERHGWWDPALRCIAIDQESNHQLSLESYRDGLKHMSSE